jgi:hypothetical protein
MKCFRFSYRTIVYYFINLIFSFTLTFFSSQIQATPEQVSSQYSISDSTLKLFHLRNKPEELITQFFQHSPLRAIYNKWLGKTQETKKQTLLLTIKEQQWLKNHPEIRLGAESDWAPFQFVDKSGHMQGFTSELVKLIESRLGIKFKVISEYSWEETLEKLRNYEIDVIGGIVKTPKRQQYLTFTKGYFSPPISIYTKKNSPEIISLDYLTNKTVSIENQYSLHERLAND